MKIKTKKKMSPEEYAKYMIDKHGISSLMSELIDDNIIDAPKRCTLTFELNTVLMKEISDTDFGNKEFIIEVEEEITEDTVLPKLVERWKHDNEGDERFRYVEHDNKSINKVLFVNPESVEVTHFYIENDNQELVLIWKDGKLI